MVCCFRLLSLGYILTVELSVSGVGKRCPQSSSSVHFVKSPPGWKVQLVSLQPPDGRPCMCVSPSGFLWGEQDANSMIRVWERRRRKKTPKTTKKHPGQKPALFTTGYCPSWCCRMSSPWASLFVAAQTTPHMKPRGQTCCNDCSYSSLALQGLTSSQHPEPSVGWLNGVHIVPHSWFKTIGQHIRKITPRKYYPGKMLLGCNIILIPWWNTLGECFIQLGTPTPES